MERQHFTPAELCILHSLLRRIYRQPNLRPTRRQARWIKDCMEQMAGRGGNVRNVFGQNKVLVALESVCMAAEDIGVHGEVLTAFVLYSLMNSDAATYIPSLHEPSDELLRFIKALDVECHLTQRTESLQDENFRNLFVAQARDMRVLLVLISWSVVIMRQVKDSENVEARRLLARQAAYLYAPLAHKLGLYALKSTLEDLSLKYLEPDAYYHIKDKLNATKQARDIYIARFIEPVKKMLDAEGLHYHIKGRTKSIHSIWQKMKKQQCAFEGVYDLFAIRIILDVPQKHEKAQCWKVFSLITSKYESSLKRLRDWLTVPKSNGYESLHITVRGPEDKWVEVQIRSERMDEIAEHGLAAHWRYKGVGSSGGGVDAWLADIRSALETGNEKLLSENLADTGNKTEVYVFTPKGDIYKLPEGATVLDFAYYIHSNVGNHCVGGRINGRNVPIRQPLESGATVEVLTAANQKPRAEWVNSVVSSHAKAKIRAAVRDLQARETTLARELLERKLKNRKMEWDESTINRLIKAMGYKESTEFYRAISEETLDVAQVIERYAAMMRRESGQAERTAIRSAETFVMDPETIAAPDGNDVLVIDRNLKGIDFQMARCCNPVYGDDVFGFVTTGGGIKIHRCNCPNATALRQRFGYRIVPARWAGKGKGKYPITLRIIGQDNIGVVNNITSIISKEEHIMLRSISIDSEGGLFSGILTVMIDDHESLTKLIKKVKTVRGVKAVSRC